MIPFNIPPYIGTELRYVFQAAEAHKICGDGEFTKKCNAWMEQRFHAQKVLLTTSGTTALDMAMLLCDLQPGDEVILPSFTFSSTATSAVLAGAKLVFVDIRPDTMNIDETKIEQAITEKTKVIVPVHYAGVACEMDTIMDIARRHHLMVVEDAAQGVMSTYKGKPLGTIGDFGCYSFHETKNYSMGEGGALVINNPAYNERAEILREKGTNRSKFYRGQVDKYTWVDFGDSYLPSELNAAYLYAQLEQADEINNSRLRAWNTYEKMLRPLADAGKLELPTVPEGCAHNAHMFYIKCKDLAERTAFIKHMKQQEIICVFHYIPLHSAPAGLKFGRFDGEDIYTTTESDRLVRLPLYYGLDEQTQQKVIRHVLDFFTRKNEVSLRPITEADTENIVRWRNADCVTEHFIFREPVTEQMHRQWFQEKVLTGTVCQFIIRVGAEKHEIGSVYFRDIDEVQKKAEFGIFIGTPELLGRGIGSRATKLALDYAFSELRLDKVYLRVLAENQRAICCYKAVGFLEDKNADETVLIDGKTESVRFMRILRSEWEREKKE